MTEGLDVPPDILTLLRSICLALPEVDEEQAWVGVRWRVANRTFAHVLTVDAGWPPAYTRAVGDDGPICVLMFRSRGEELAALRGSGHPFFEPVWRADEVGMVVAAESDPTEIAELVTESYCSLAPKRLVDQLRS